MIPFANLLLLSDQANGSDSGGFTIDQSLRFDGTAFLTHNFAGAFQNTVTISFWFKPNSGGALSSNDNIRGTFYSAAGGNSLYYQWDNTNQGLIQNPSGAAVSAAGRYRDPTAWYHLVFNYNATSNTSNIFINGNQVGTNQVLDSDFATGNFRIGTFNNETSGQWPFNGYMAEWYLIDGQTLTATSFGEDNNGVWRPIEYEGTYGNNSFHLTFSSSQTNGIGHDSSGEGNHFTGSNFDEGEVGKFSEFLVSSSGTWNSGRTPTGLFGDTDTSTMAQVGQTGATMTFTPAYPISYNSLSYFNHGATWNLNGETTGGSTGSGGWQTIDANPGTLTSLQFLNSTGGAAAVGAIAINGTAAANILVDDVDTDVDFFDTPTSNFNTYNPLGSDNTFSLGNLRTSAPNYQTSTSTIGITTSSGKFYWEITMDNVSGNQTLGASVLDSQVDANTITNWVFAPNLEDIESDQGNLTDFIEIATTPIATANGTTYMFAYDSDLQHWWIGDSGNWYKRDGAAGAGNPSTGANPLMTTADACIVDGETYGPATAGSATGATAYLLNCGQMPFIYETPTGFKKLQTNNLTTPSIKNGKEYFDVREYTSAATAADLTVNDLEFQPDLIWFKSRSNGSGWETADVVRGTNNLMGIDDNGTQSTTANTCKAFGVNGSINGFTLGTGQSNINFNSRTYTAYCWKAGGATVTNNDGSIESQVSANTEAGFSVVGYTGNNQTLATVGHGLSKPPNCIIIKDRNSTTNWVVYHSGIDATAPEDFGTIFDTASVASDNVAFWNDTAPTESVFTINTNSDVNPNDTNSAVAWCWHDVEGFQKFGSFIGNGLDDGSYVYLGFKPAFVIIKKTFGGNEWHSWDSTANPTNPVRNCLLTSGPDTQDTIGRIDFLSNGFKLRTTNTVMNHDGLAYLYMAWAEYPSGGENTTPAPGR